MALIISEVNFIGGGIGLGSRPRMNPKSTWNILPASSIFKRLIEFVIFRKKKQNEMAKYNINNYHYGYG
jgi:hypothetical protein